MADLAENNHRLTKFEKAAIILAVASSALDILFPFLPFKLRFMSQITYLPAVLFGIRSWRRTKFYGKSLPVIACVVLVIIGIVWTPRTELGRAVLIAVHLVSVLPIAALIVDKRAMRLCASTFVTASTITVLIAMKIMISTVGLDILQKFGNLIDDTGTVVTNTNELGASFGLALLLSTALVLGCFRECKSKKKLFDKKLIYYLAASIILALAAILTGSRGAFIATFAGVFILLMSKSNGLARGKVIAIISILMITAVVVISFATGVSPTERLTSRFSGGTVGDFNGRIPIWEQTIDIVVNKSFYIIYGTGTGGAEKLVGTFERFARRGEDGIYRRSTHSSYVEWFTYFGLLGIIPALGLMWSAVQRAIKLDKVSHSTNRTAILIFFLVFAFNGVVFRSSYWTVLGSMILALLSYSSLADQSCPIFGSPDASKKSKRLRPTRTAAAEYR